MHNIKIWNLKWQKWNIDSHKNRIFQIRINEIKMNTSKFHVSCCKCENRNVEMLICQNLVTSLFHAD